MKSNGNHDHSLCESNFVKLQNNVRARCQEGKTGEESSAWGKGHVGRQPGLGTSESCFSVTSPPRSWLVTLKSELPQHWWTGSSLEMYHYEYHWLHPESCLQTGENKPDVSEGISWIPIPQVNLKQSRKVIMMNERIKCQTGNNLGSKWEVKRESRDLCGYS